MLLWACAIVMPHDRPTGWERPRRVKRPQGGAPAGAVIGRAATVNLFVNGVVRSDVGGEEEEDRRIRHRTG